MSLAVLGVKRAVPGPGALFQAAPNAAVLEFPQIYEEYFDFVWRNLRRLGVQEDAAADALQDVFIVVHRRLRDFQVSQGSFRGWLFGIVFRVGKDHRRSMARKHSASRRSDQPIDPDTVAASTENPEERAELAEQMRVLHAVLDQLDDRQRTALILAELEQMTAPEIANILGIPLNTVYSRLRAARHAFDLALARYQGTGAPR